MTKEEVSKILLKKANKKSKWLVFGHHLVEINMKINNGIQEGFFVNSEELSKLLLASSDSFGWNINKEVDTLYRLIGDITVFEASCTN